MKAPLDVHYWLSTEAPGTQSGDQTMQIDESVFDRTIRSYLKRIETLSFDSIAPKVGGALEGNAVRIPLLGNDHWISPQGITGPSGEQPTHDICVILSQYLLRCPDRPPEGDAWVTFRDLRDSGPLTTYFGNDVERALASHFSGRVPALKEASRRLEAAPPSLDAGYDLAAAFEALPRVPVLLLFNDRDDEFPAACSVLFERRAEAYLDAECLAMLGTQLFHHLKHARCSRSGRGLEGGGSSVDGGGRPRLP